MSTSRTTRSTKAIGLTGFLGNIVDDTKDFVDDMIGRARDVEHDLRDTAQRTFREDDGDEEDLLELRRQLDDLREKINRLPESQQNQPPN